MSPAKKVYKEIRDKHRQEWYVCHFGDKESMTQSTVVQHFSASHTQVRYGCPLTRCQKLIKQGADLPATCADSTPIIGAVAPKSAPPAIMPF